MRQTTSTTALILPGIGDSGPAHWQSLWEAAHTSFVRVRQRDWDHPVCAEWMVVLEDAVAKAGADTVLVAHSVSCLLVAHWAAQTSLKLRGALLVAPPDPEGANFPKEVVGFSPLPLQRFPFPSIVVASATDPYASLEFAKFCALAWGSDFVNVGALGHINSESGVGVWAEGYDIFRRLAA